MNDVQTALETDRTVDITTVGRRSGMPRRIEIWFHNVEGRIFITGLPGRRDWYANVAANPRLTFHLKEGTQADLDAIARTVVDEDERRSILDVVTTRIHQDHRLDEWVERSPLIEVTFSENI